MEMSKEVFLAMPVVTIEFVKSVPFGEKRIAAGTQMMGRIAKAWKRADNVDAMLFITLDGEGYNGLSYRSVIIKEKE